MGVDTKALQSVDEFEKQPLLPAADGKNFKGERRPGFGVHQFAVLEHITGLFEQYQGFTPVRPVAAGPVARRQAVCPIHDCRAYCALEWGEQFAFTIVGGAIV